MPKASVDLNNFSVLQNHLGWGKIQTEEFLDRQVNSLIAMRRSIYQNKSQLLQQLMQKAGIASVRELSKIAGVPELQLIKLQYGLLPKLPLEFTLNVASALKISVNQFIETFISSSTNFDRQPQNNDSVRKLELLQQEYQSLEQQLEQQKESLAALESLQKEYQRLEQQLEQQKESLHQEFQQESLQVLESWLLQWPTAIAIVQKNPKLPAGRILPLIKPVEQLLEKWGLESIASVGEEVPYNPRQHELIKGISEIGETVKVRYVGYKQGDKLLYRAKVSAIDNSEILN